VAGHRSRSPIQFGPASKTSFQRPTSFSQVFTLNNDRQNEMARAVTEGRKDYAGAAQDWIDVN
jgi:hypothetical protein